MSISLPKFFNNFKIMWPYSKYTTKILLLIKRKERKILIKQQKLRFVGRSRIEITYLP